jgi:hypothetical protein
MKTLFIAALVGLLVVPVVGNATNHNWNKSSYWDQIRSWQQLNKMHQLFVDRFTKAVKDIRDLENSFKAHAKNAPDKIQREQLLALAAGYAKQRKQIENDIAVAKQKIFDNRIRMCDLYNNKDKDRYAAKFCRKYDRRKYDRGRQRGKRGGG